MTAIVWDYISEGFVVGADGRTIDPDTNQVESEKAQKIFFVKKDRLELVYAWSGTTIFERIDKTIFDLHDATDCVLDSIDMSAVASFSDFLRLFRDCLNALLLFYIGGAVKTFTTKSIAQVLFLAYFESQPVMAEIFLEHNGMIVQRPRVTCPPVSVRFSVFSGSERVYKEMESRIKVEPPSTRIAAELVREYISRCIEYQAVDSSCAKIGGHIHTGRLSSAGFSWIVPPISN